MTLEQSKKIERVSTRFTNWVGSPASIIFHTLFFMGIFVFKFLGVSIDKILLILTTVVSLEAIYLAIFIQMTVNRNTQSLEEVEENIDEIQEDVEEIQKDVDEVQKDVEDIALDVEEVQKDVDVVQKDVGEIQKDVLEEDDMLDFATKKKLENIELALHKIIMEIESLKQTKNNNSHSI